MKRVGTFRSFATARTAAARAAIVAGAMGLCVCAAAQQRTADSSPPVSNLSQQNLNFAGASATQIKAVVLQDAGLLVELKRWVATDATNHGQVIGEEDLTDDTIFDRLETD